MAVQWDAVLAREVARELHARLSRTRMRAYWLDAERRRATLFTDAGCLEWRLHPREGHVRLFPARAPFEGAVPLRSTVLGVSAPPDERRIQIHVRAAKGENRDFIFHIALATNQRNAILVNGLGTIEKILAPRANANPPLQVGHPYSPPAASERAGLGGALDREEWATRVEAVGSPSQLKGVAWISSLNAAALDETEDAFALWRLLGGFRNAADHPTPGPPSEAGVLTLARGPNPYPVALPGVERAAAESLLDAFALCEGTHEAPLDPALEARLQRARKRTVKRLRSLEGELKRSEDPEQLRGWADLILARLNTIPRGVSTAPVEGFDGVVINLDLDAKLSPRENADALYDRAGRATRARKELPARIAETNHRVEALDEALVALGRGERPDDELLGTVPHTQRAESGQTGPALPYRVYRSSGGLEIWVGRGSKSNDALTFQHARPNDVWLHARDAAGAHVVLRWSEDESPPARDLEDAALLAAQFSKARHSGWVPVDWTRRKHVRKPRKAPAGSVIPSRVKTVFVEPDTAKADAMAVRD